MLKFNTSAGMRNRFFTSLEQVLRDIPKMPGVLKTSFMAAIFLCCFSPQSLEAQCNIGYAPGVTGDVQLSLDNSGTAILNATFFEPFVTSTFPQCLPVNGANLEVWENNVPPLVPYQTGLPGPNFDCSNVGDIVLVYVTLDDAGPGVQSAPLEFTVQIVDLVPPVVSAPLPVTMSADPGACSVEVNPLEALVSDNCPGNITVNWERLPGGSTPGSGTGNAGGIYNVGTTTVEYEVSDGTNTVTVSTTVTVTDDEAPTITGCPGDITVSTSDNGTGDCSTTANWVEPIAGDNCGLSFFTQTHTPNASLFGLGTTTVTYTASDGSLTTTCSFDVTVEDDEDPIFGFLPTNRTYSPVGCTQTLTESVAVVTDNCDLTPTVTYEVDHNVNGVVASGTASSFTHDFEVGINTVTFTAEDNEGNISTHTYVITVEDNQNPVATCMDITVQLDGSGSVTVDAEEMNDGSTDNCVIDDFVFRKDAPGNGPYEPTKTFDCTDIGTHLMRFRAIDASGNDDNDNTCSVTVEDNVPPVAICQDITVTLSAGDTPPNEADVFAAAVHGTPFIDNGSNDNCTAIGDLVIRIRKGTSGSFESQGDPVTFDCSEVGANTVEIRVRDEEGNTNFCSATVTVVDGDDPVASCSPTTIQLDSNGDASIVPGDVDGGSTDNCGIASMAVSPNTFDCSDLGGNTVTLTVTDVGGNTDDCTTTVTVEDDENPVASCQPVTVYLDATGNGTAYAHSSYGSPFVDDGSTDNCNIVDYEISMTPTFFDPTPPFLPSLDFDCDDVFASPIPIRFRVRDQSGNESAICTTTVTVVDLVPPVAICTPVSVGLLSSGDVTIDPFQLSLLSSDNCFTLLGPCGLDREISVDTDGDGNPDTPFSTSYTFDCDDVGSNVVDVKLTDCHGNSAICETTVTIQDNEAPFIECPADITVECTDPNPDNQDLTPGTIGSDVTEVFILPLVPDSGTAYDNCDLTIGYSDAARVYSIDCSISGWVYYVDRTWTAQDDEPNTASCVQRIYVEDTTIPTFSAPADATVDCKDGSTEIVNKVCNAWSSVDVPQNIVFIGTDLDTSELVITAEGKIMDVNVFDLEVEHTSVDQVYIRLESPNGTSVDLYVPSCSDEDNIEINFDDESANSYGSFPCPPTDNGFYQPAGSLSDFIGEQMSGTWLLIVQDFSTVDGGNLISWGLDICYVTPPTANSVANITGDVTDEDDNCDMPDATFIDYQAFKDFQSNTVYLSAAPTSVTYDFSPGEWTFSSSIPSPHDGSWSSVGAPASISITGADDGTSGAESNLEITIPEMGWVIFDWSYSSSDADADPADDPFGYYIGTSASFVQLTDNGDGLSQNGRAVIPVMASDVFGFSQQSDGDAGEATTTITNFVYVDKLICPMPDMYCPRDFCIARLWDLVDDCGNVAPTQAQIIRTTDSMGPTFDHPTTLSILAQGGICTPFVDLDLASSITDGCSDASGLTITNDAQANYGTGDGLTDASGFYAPGVYTIEWTATDECGNTTYHTVVMTVTDSQNPFAVCHPAVTVQLDNTGNAILNTSNVDNGSSDNCGITSMMLSQSVFTMADVGQVPVTLTVFDAEGNSNSCTSLVTVLGGVIFDAGDVSGPSTTPATVVNVPVYVHDFVDILSFDVDVLVNDGTVAEIIGITNLHPAISIPSVLFNGVINTPTDLSAFMTDFSAPPGVDIPDGEILFEIEVELVGAPNTSSPVTVTVNEVSQLLGGGPASGVVPGLGLNGSINILSNTTVSVSGLFRLESLAPCSSQPIHMVNVDMTGTIPGNIPSAAGSYSFNVPVGATVTVEPTKNINWTNGVTTADAQNVHSHAAGFVPLNSAYKIIAADASGNDQVTTFDASLIQQLAIGFIPDIPGNTSWRFVPENPALSGNPFLSGFDETITFTNVVTPQVGNFIGIKTGDVNCTNDPVNQFTNDVDDRNSKLHFLITDQAVTAGEEVSVTFKAGDNFEDILSYQFTTNWDDRVLEFVEAVPGTLTNLSSVNFNPMRADEGLLATNWYNLAPVDLNEGFEIFTLKFIALEDAPSLVDIMGISSDYIVAEVLKGSEEILGADVTIDGVTSNSELGANHFALYQNRPNPFGYKTAIGFTLPQSSETTLTILDPAGRVLKLVKGYFTAGYHQIVVDRKDLPAKGILFYRLETATDMAVKKMILLD